jgi:hypothetical protein
MSVTPVPGTLTVSQLWAWFESPRALWPKWLQDATGPDKPIGISGCGCAILLRGVRLRLDQSVTPDLDVIPTIRAKPKVAPKKPVGRR